MKTVTAVFDTRAQAVAAVDALHASGFRRDRVSVVMTESLDSPRSPAEALGQHAAEGAGVGAAMGGVLGFAALGLVSLVPGVGLIAAGPLVAALIGAGAGGAAGTLTGALVGAGLTDVEAARSEQWIAKGGALVAVDVEDERAPAAVEALRALGGRDLLSEAA